jgi:hypothetical protein
MKEERVSWDRHLDDLGELGVGRVLAEGPHDAAKLPDRDEAVAIVVEQLGSVLKKNYSCNCRHKLARGWAEEWKNKRLKDPGLHSLPARTNINKK